MQKRLLGLAAMVLVFTGVAQAQTAGVVTLTASPASGTGSVTPVLTWSTNPVATSCTASGGWSGTKAASGTQTLSAINANTNYTLTCTWGSGSAIVSWNAPTTNTDGTALTNLARFRVLYGPSSTNFTSSQTVDDPTARSTTINSLPAGNWYFTVKVVNTAGVESANSNVATKNVTGATAAKTVGVTVTAATPLLTTKATNVWDVRRRSDGVWVRNAVVGIIALGKPCYTTFKVGSKHYLINRSDATRIHTTPISTNLVVNCVG